MASLSCHWRHDAGALTDLRLSLISSAPKRRGVAAPAWEERGRGFGILAQLYQGRGQRYAVDSAGACRLRWLAELMQRRRLGSTCVPLNARPPPNVATVLCSIKPPQVISVFGTSRECASSHTSQELKVTFVVKPSPAYASHSAVADTPDTQAARDRDRPTLAILLQDGDTDGMIFSDVHRRPTESR